MIVKILRMVEINLYDGGTQLLIFFVLSTQAFEEED